MENIKQIIDALPKLEGEERTYVINALLENIGALPLKKSIIFDGEGTIHIHGRPLDVEQAIAFKESVHALYSNQARKLINDQIRFLAVEFGVHKALSPEQMSFAKSALWIIEEENKLIESIIGTDI